MNADELRDRIEMLRAKSANLPVDDGRRVASRNALSDAEHALHVCLASIERAETALIASPDAGLHGGWQIVRGA